MMDDTTLYISYSLSPREIKKVHESKGKQKWNGTHQLLLYADYINYFRKYKYYKQKQKIFPLGSSHVPELLQFAASLSGS
jgi:hypothetical protein